MDEQRKAEIGFAFFKQNTGLDEALRQSQTLKGEIRMMAYAGIDLPELREFLSPFKEEAEAKEQEKRAREQEANRDKIIFITDDSSYPSRKHMAIEVRPFSEMRHYILNLGKRVVFVITKPEISKLFEETEKEISGIAEKQPSLPKEFQSGDTLLVLHSQSLDELCYNFMTSF